MEKEAKVVPVEVNEVVVNSAKVNEYKMIDRTYKAGMGLLLANIPLYWIYAIGGEFQPGWQSVLHNFGGMALHFSIGYGVFWKLSNRLNSRFEAMIEENS